MATSPNDSLSTLLKIEIAFTQLKRDNLLLLRSYKFIIRELTLIYTGIFDLSGLESLAGTLGILVVLGSPGGQI